MVSVSIIVMLAAGAVAQMPTAALFADEAMGADAELVAALHQDLADAGYAVTLIDGAALCDGETLTADAFALLALPDAKRLPMRSIEPVHEYLKQGGNMLALNTPAWRERLIFMNDEWQTQARYREQTALDAPPNIILDFSQESLDDWHRSAMRMDTPTQHTIAPDALAPGAAALDVTAPEFENWDSACRLFAEPPVPEGHTVTVFAARGGPNTNQLAVEWRERDGSRWIAVVPITEQWQRFMLVPEDFKFWESVSGRRDSALNPANTDMIAFTLAYTHTGHLEGNHHFQVAQVGTAARDAELGEILGDVAAPALDAISPTYKFYATEDVATFTAAADQTLLPAMDFDVPAIVRAVHPRPEASGFDKGRPWRWLPLIEARAADGALRGYPAVMIVNADGAYKNSVWASFGIEDSAWYLSEGGRVAVRGAIKRMKTPVYFLDAGADRYTYLEGQAVVLGAQIATTDASDDVPLKLSLRVLNHDGDVIADNALDIISPQAGEPARFETRWQPETWVADGFVVRAELLQGDRLLDQATHEIHCWRPNPEPSFVTVGDGRFMRDGERWRPHGINYMPSSGIAIEWYHYFEQWLGAAAYHPNVIQRDLERCAAMGCNSLSIFLYHESMKAQNLLDILRRMDALGMKANLSLRPGTPMDFPWEDVREMIETLRLPENDTVFAYDLAWEPMFRHWERDPFNPEWEAWIIERYGSLENAEADWDFPVPRGDDGAVVNFEPHQIGPDGPWNRMIAAYRRFLDTLLYEKYAEARRLVRTVDPHTLVSFRMSMAGDPTDTMTDAILYDFAYLAGAVDILQPEGYGRIGDWERIKPGWFTYEYARWANPELPVLWAEAGVHVWDMAHMDYTNERLAFQGAYYANFYRMLEKSGADGIYWWWYPGGFRTNENSDYGVIHPDGTDRPVTRVIREQGPQFTQAPDAPPVDTWLVFDRDAHTNGLTGVYSALADDFWSAIEAGQTPGLKTEATGTDSTNCPPLAVGNTPWSGSNPPKYLDAFFDYMEVQSGDGNWTRVLPGDSVSLAADGSAKLRITFTNLGEAALVPPAEAGDAPGGVYITVSGDLQNAAPLPQRLRRFEQLQLELPLAETPLTAVTEVVLSFDARDRTPFGQKFAFTLEPRDMSSPSL